MSEPDEPSSKTATKFLGVELPTGETGYMPDGVRIQFPTDTNVARERLHLLGYIPWDEKYLERVPDEYRQFFLAILPHLGSRTTDVHTAICLGMMREMIDAADVPVDERIAHIALVLHDAGWSQMDPDEIADSLDYKGLSHNGEEEIAKAPKQKHDLIGHEIARRVVDEYEFAESLSSEQKDLICAYIRHHTFPREYRPEDEMPVELKLMHDTDRLWSYTHENFWQDTIRKRVDPQVYACNLAIAIDGYFLTEQAKVKAQELLLEREVEVAELEWQLLKAPAAMDRVVFA